MPLSVQHLRFQPVDLSNQNSIREATRRELVRASLADDSKLVRGLTR